MRNCENTTYEEHARERARERKLDRGKGERLDSSARKVKRQNKKLRDRKTWIERDRNLEGKREREREC